ncbi:hypothetical protein BGZ98_006754 [Dissophora globulifera]|nr:hypothetical protein BGZ98_006754 [Dissophora globulifera]
MMQALFSPDETPQQSVDLASMDYRNIMSLGFPFVPTKRVSVNCPEVDLWQEVESTAVKGGTPLILEHWHKLQAWDNDLFTFSHIAAKYGNHDFACRDLRNARDVRMSMRDYIRQVHGHDPDGAHPGVEHGAFDGHGSPPSARASKKSAKSKMGLLEPLLYAKDVTCPADWRTFLMDKVLPPFLGYMRENDLNYLNTEVAAENLMIYIGQAGTWCEMCCWMVGNGGGHIVFFLQNRTPAHMDQCGAIGHNIMTWADDDSSSIWFMVKEEDKDRAEVLWRSFGHPLEYEGYFASLEELQRADFPIYVVEQKVGDFVMVPSMGYHQVVNLGKATIKVSWNRLTAHCLKAAINVVLPRVMRPEGYRIRTIIQSALQAWTTQLESQSREFSVPKEYFCESFKTILTLFRQIVEEEWVDMDALKIGKEEFHKPKRLTNTMPAVCDFCSSDIWNRQFQCLTCSKESFSMKSCRILYSNAIRAWNKSKALKGCQGHERLVDDWSDRIMLSRDTKPSSTSMAYLRQHELQKVYHRSCHRCKGVNKHIINIRCSDCQTLFCENCILRYHQIPWKDVALVNESGWWCPICTDTCHCASCDKKANIGRPKLLPPPPPPTLKFTRPDEDSRNRGSVIDGMKRSFAPRRDTPRSGQRYSDASIAIDDLDSDDDASENDRGHKTGKHRLINENRDSDGGKIVRKRLRGQSPRTSKNKVARLTAAAIETESAAAAAWERMMDTEAATEETTITKTKKRGRKSAAESLGMGNLMSHETASSSSSSLPSSYSPSSLSSSSTLSPDSSPEQRQLRHRQQKRGMPEQGNIALHSFQNLMSSETEFALKEQEWALRYARENGLRHTTQVLEQQRREATQMEQYYADLFRMDRFCRSRGEQTKQSFRLDMIEKEQWPLGSNK